MTYPIVVIARPEITIRLELKVLADSIRCSNTERVSKDTEGKNEEIKSNARMDQVGLLRALAELFLPSCMFCYWY